MELAQASLAASLSRAGRDETASERSEWLGSGGELLQGLLGRALGVKGAVVGDAKAAAGDLARTFQDRAGGENERKERHPPGLSVELLIRDAAFGLALRQVSQRP